MEQLTIRLNPTVNRCAKVSTDLCYKYENCFDCPQYKKMVDRLAAYEETGLEPEEIKEHEAAKYNAGYYHGDEDRCRWVEKELGPIEHLRDLLQAEQDGRLVVLPCKFGDTVYTTHWWKDVMEKCTDSKGKPFYRMVSKKIVKKERFDPFGPHYEWLGKTVFLTREEAEAALAGKGGE